MLIRPKRIGILFISVYLTCCILTFIGKTAELENFYYYILILIITFAALNAAELGGSRLYKRAYNKITGREFLFIEKREKTFIRQTGPDIVRCIAVFFVPLIHFFGLSGYYSTALDSKGMLYFTMLRNIAVCAVPVFLIITGYFKIEKSISRSHYKAVIPVLLSHIFITSIRLYVDYKYHGADLNGEYIADKLLYFNYGWYVKLYIGMLLLMPFLNLSYNALKKREHKEYLILTLVFLTALGPAVFNIVPKSWLILYVFMYYFIGGYLKEYKLKINKPFLAVMLFATVFISSFAQFKAARGGLFSWDYLAYSDNSGYSSFPVVVSSVIIFMLFMDIRIKIKPVRHLLKGISVVSLEMYLFSQMFDGIIYTPIQQEGMNFYFFAENIFLFVITVFLLSYIAAKGKQLVFFIIFNLPCFINEFIREYIKSNRKKGVAFGYEKKLTGADKKPDIGEKKSLREDGNEQDLHIINGDGGEDVNKENKTDISDKADEKVKNTEGVNIHTEKTDYNKNNKYKIDTNNTDNINKEKDINKASCNKAVQKSSLAGKTGSGRKKNKKKRKKKKR